MNDIRSLCLYCGSRVGSDPAYSAAAEAFGRWCAENGIRLVFGGGSIGLMGVAARAALAAGGKVTGIIPRHLDHVEITLPGLSDLHVVDSMHERKDRMFRESDGFVVLPGGIGTLDEFIEITTWRQLGLHDRPVILVNIAGYWTPFLAMLENIVDQGLAAPETRDLFAVAGSIEEIPARLADASGRGPARPSLF